MNSLERRLQLSLVLVLALVFGLIWAFGHRTIDAITEDFVASRLEHDAESLLGALQPGSDRSRLRWRRMNQVYYQPFSGHYYVVLFDNGNKVQSRSLWDHSLPVEQLAPGQARRSRQPGPSGQDLLIWAKGFRKQGTDLTLAVAEDITSLAEHRNRLQRDFALLAFGGTIGLLTLLNLLLRRAFRRLDPVREDIRRLERGEAGRLSDDVPTEVLPLVHEFNHLLLLLNQRIERSRNALGNLAHAIKGPLQLLLRYFDKVSASSGDASTRDARIQTERIRQLMDRELKRARLAGRGTPMERFNPARDLPDLVSVLQRIHEKRGLDISFRLVNDIEPFGEREDMLELLGNLLDNACKWARSRVICVLSGSEGIQIAVEDDGSGLPDEDLHRLAKRGSRLDETIDGHGLGLAITGDIVKLYGGRILFERSPELGGLKVQVRLPGQAAV